MKTNKKLIYNVLGYALALIGIVALFMSKTIGMSIVATIVAFIGSIVIGGLPKMKNIKKLFKVNITLLIVGVVFLIFYYKIWGANWVLRDAVSWGFGLFFIGTLVAGTIKGLIED